MGRPAFDIGMGTLLVLCSLALSGCATGYQPLGSSGGYSEHPGPGEMQLVIFQGNSHIDPRRVEVYVTFRCAELAKQSGHPYFTMYDTLLAAAHDKPGKPVARVNLTQPTASVFLLFHAEPAPGALSTDEVIARLGPEIGR